jgi:Rieske Fe-S protein
MDRRKFLDTLLWTSLAGAAVTPLAMLPAYLVPPEGVLRSKRINLGAVPAGSSKVGRSGARVVIAVNEGSLRVFDAACTHDRCPVRWDGPAKKFVCDCHGAEFDGEGKVTKGPAKTPLAALPHFIENGEVVVE